MSSPSDSPTLSKSKLPTFITLHIRLDRTNNTYWRSQVVATVRAHGFENILINDGSSIPTVDGSIASSSTATNAATEWHRRDQFLLSWLLSSISEVMLGHVSRFTHSFQVWNFLEDLYYSQSQARVMSLRLQLQTLKKGSLTVDDYLLQMRTIVDGLLAAGHEVSDDDLVLYLLGCLGTEFEAIVISLTTRREAPSIAEVHSILRTHEVRLLQSSTGQQVALPGGSASGFPAANVVSGNSRGSSNGNNGKFKGRNRFSNKSKVFCQLCGKPNHISAKCYKRFDASFTGLEVTHHQSPSPGSIPQFQSGNQFQANIAQQSPFYPQFPYNFHPQQSHQSHYQSQSAPPQHGYPLTGNTSSHTTQTNTSYASPSSDWFIDSGATNHVTSQLGNLQLQTPYTGSDHSQDPAERGTH